MKEYMYCDKKIEAFQFNGTLDLQTYPKDNIPPAWFPTGYFNNDFCEIRDPATGNTILQHCEKSMHVQFCRKGDWIGYDPERPDIGVFFLSGEWFHEEATEVTKTSYDSLTEANIARQKEWDTGTEPLSLSFKGNELAGETGELCNVLKKLERERLGIPGSRDTVEHAAEEMADVIICVDLIATHLGVDLWQAVAKKFNATSEKNGMKTRLVIPNG